MKAEPPHAAILRRGVDAWNAWRKKDRDLQPQLSRAHLSGMDLRGANLAHCNLRHAHMRGCDLRRTLLRSALLSGADLTGANLQNADLRAASLRRAKLNRADVRNAVLRHVSCVETDFDGADLRGAEIYGVAAWRLKGTPKHQSNLVVRAGRHDPAITVDSLEVAQFVFLLLNNPKIRDVIETVGHKAVLILGRFKPERKAVLDAIRTRLRELDRVPVLFDFEAPHNRDVFETVRTLASMVRFVIADLSEAASVIQEVTMIVENFRIVPVQPIVQEGFDTWAMFQHLAANAQVLPLRSYDTPQTLLAAMEKKIIVPAERLAARLVADHYRAGVRKSRPRRLVAGG